MFGCCVAGRLLQTNLHQVDETHAFFELPSASTINHICVFLLGTVPFPEGYGATVHFFWPGKGFQLLGMISNEKPSAIFRLRGTNYAPSTMTSSLDAMASASSTPVAGGDVTAILGLSVEPLAQILPQLPSAVVKSPDLTKDSAVLAEKIVKNLFNYVSGFIGSGGITPDTAVPMSIIAKWYDNFGRKVRMGGIGFLEGED